MDVENNNKKSDVKEQGKGKPLDIGAILVEARENNNLSAHDIALQMNLTLAVIEQIEANQFTSGLPITYIRGYVRSYAQNVGVDVETISVEFERQVGISSAPLQKNESIASYKTSRKELDSNSLAIKAVTYLIVIGLLLFGGWELWSRFSSPQLSVDEFDSKTSSNISEKTDIGSGLLEVSEPKISESNIDKSEVNKLEANKTEANNAEIDTLEVATPEIASTVETISSDSSTKNITQIDTNAKQSESTDSALEQMSLEINKPLITGPLVKLQLLFNGECWVEISDANGKTLAFGMYNVDETILLEGIVPISVKLGDPSVVSVLFKDESYDMSRFKPQRTANFTLK